MEEEQSAHAAKVGRTVAARYDRAYKGKKFKIVKEVHLPPGQVFTTEFGHPARHGYIIEDLDTGHRKVVTRTLLTMIAARYQGVELPDRRRRLVDFHRIPTAAGAPRHT